MKKQCEAAGNCQMGGFTRLLHTGQPDDLMNEIPTWVAKPLPAEHPDHGCALLVATRGVGECWAGSQAGVVRWVGDRRGVAGWAGSQEGVVCWTGSPRGVLCWAGSQAGAEC
jgi:hypothetical protein